MGQRSPICFSTETTIVFANAGNIPVAGTLVEVPRCSRSAGKMRVRFHIDALNTTLGDGTTGHAIAIVAKMGNQGAINEFLGFAGMNLAGANTPQVPLRTDRDFTMLIDVMEGYDQIGLAGFAAAETYGAGNTLTVGFSWVLDDGSATP